MNHSKLFATATLLATSVLPIAPSAFAQTPAPFGDRGAINEQDIYHPPEAYVLNATANVREDRSIEGTVTLWNKGEEILGDMSYTIELLGELPPTTGVNQVVEDNAPVYDIAPSTDRFALLKDEKKTLSYTYSPPKNLPGGTYRLQFIVSNGRGRTMGWYDVPVTLPGEKTPFAQIVPEGITIAEFGSEKFVAESGPNIDPGKNITIGAVASSTSPLSAVPVFDIYHFSPSRELLKTVRGATVNATKNGTPLSMSIPTSQEPGIYVGLLSLQNPATNESLSNVVKFRWVVRGKDADILYARIQSFGYNANDSMTLSIDYVGAGDATTKSTGTIALALKDDAGQLGTLDVPNVQLDDGINTGSANISLPRDLVGTPTLDIEITAENGKSLVSYSAPFPFTEEQISTLEKSRLFSRTLLIAAAVLILIGIAILAKSFFGGKRKR